MINVDFSLSLLFDNVFDLFYITNTLGAIALETLCGTKKERIVM